MERLRMEEKTVHIIYYAFMLMNVDLKPYF